MVATMRGEVAPERLGTTLMHEHVFVVNLEVAANFPTGWEEDTAVSRAIERMAELRTAAVDTIVDLTVVGLGRDIPRLRRVAEATDLHIVVATGLYTFHDLPMYFSYRKTEVMTEYFVADIETGIAAPRYGPGSSNAPPTKPA